MGSAPLYCTDVEIVGTNPYDPGLIVGDPVTAWSDIWTDNYSEAWASATSVSGHQDWATATIAPVDIPDGAVVQNVDFTAIVALANTGGATQGKWILELGTTDDDRVAFVGQGADKFITSPVDGEWHTIDFLGGSEDWWNANSGNEYPIANIAPLLRQGCRVSTYRLSGTGAVLPYGHMLRTAYLVGVVGWTGGGIPPLRQNQRDDLRNTGRNSRQRSLRNTSYL